ncbi:DUF120 domain-containing protein [Pyrobaculum aerophilum]|uniref:Riboflavin kinase n=2 Tax=Pyrobaculum aerophilum TaxID=13773 RepID=RIFK_PYRAE|nr:MULTISPECIES: DUF120 domain-containing protein [Pyrobaculum]Q8ZVR7.1 RecName: Full=Riboflavin kinase; Short=RFK; AltName: Full=CTP-dependent riboflavin kinase; AltName: Full=CTP:riboflavin 5'-phosphotransferase; AltName: Full=Flavokinase [Pyrobaculum aerophilum str. IM2]AAL63989.1 conserved hypothetical protein [Pyrobaculum aerophilum str. IM2]MCX8136415.1 CTP-dependent riboflavin kinase [Pyrobaculum aerophilum]HII47242.1 DUF120 domain-containing protein [Pyrobaculum aerophilum]
MECKERRLIGDLIALSYVEGLPVAEAAKRLCVTRQGLYKLLKQLRNEGYVAEGPLIKITQKGRDLLSSVLRDLLRYFNIASIRLIGRVISGLGEGAFYISLEGYRRAIEEKLGFTPFPGTLNIKLDPQYLPYRRYLDGLPGIVIPGFTNGLRTYGGVKAFKAKINGVEGAVVMPERTHHPTDVIEIIAPVKLRDALNLKDGDIVEVEILL